MYLSLSDGFKFRPISRSHKICFQPMRDRKNMKYLKKIRVLSTVVGCKSIHDSVDLHGFTRQPKKTFYLFYIHWLIDWSFHPFKMDPNVKSELFNLQARSNRDLIRFRRRKYANFCKETCITCYYGLIEVFINPCILANKFKFTVG